MTSHTERHWRVTAEVKPATLCPHSKLVPSRSCSVTPHCPHRPCLCVWGPGSWPWQQLLQFIPSSVLGSRYFWFPLELLSWAAITRQVVPRLSVCERGRASGVRGVFMQCKDFLIPLKSQQTLLLHNPPLNAMEGKGMDCSWEAAMLTWSDFTVEKA